MKLFTKICYTVGHGVESLLDQVENQEALARATVQEVERALVRSRTAHKQARRQLEQLQQQDAELVIATERWGARALRLREDRARALECVRRRKQREHERQRVQQHLQRQEAVCERIAADEQALEARLLELRSRCAELSSRQAHHGVHRGGASAAEVDALFDRWEARLEDGGPFDATSLSADPLADELEREESEAELEAELEKILTEAEADR